MSGTWALSQDASCSPPHTEMPLLLCLLQALTPLPGPPFLQAPALTWLCCSMNLPCPVLSCPVPGPHLRVQGVILSYWLPFLVACTSQDRSLHPVPTWEPPFLFRSPLFKCCVFCEASPVSPRRTRSSFSQDPRLPPSLGGHLLLLPHQHPRLLFWFW